jgi:hypothetical protein
MLAVFPADSGTPFSDIPRLEKERWFSLGKTTNCIVIHWTHVIGF